MLVRAPDSAAAVALLSAYRAGHLALDEAVVDRPACPACLRSLAQDDSWPRRQVFIAYLLCSYGALALIFLEDMTNSTIFGALGAILLGLPILASLAPCMVRLHVLRRYCCINCETRWRAPELPGFGRLQHDAQT